MVDCGEEGSGVAFASVYEGGVVCVFCVGEGVLVMVKVFSVDLGVD